MMLDYRNSYFHASNYTVYQHREEPMTAVIWWEFSLRQNILPASYLGLFTGQVQRILKDDVITKYQWPSSVWNAWYWVRITAGLGVFNSNQMVETFIQRHASRRKRKLRELSSLILVI